MVAKHGKSPLGQPFIQEIIGSQPEDGIVTATMKVMLGPTDENLKTKQRVRVELQNYKFGRPDMFLPGLKVHINAATQRGNILDSDPTKNPFSALNDAYRGTKLIVVANMTGANPHSGQDSEERLYCTLVAGLVMYDNAHTLDISDRMIPDFPEGIPAGSIQGVVATTEAVAKPPEPVYDQTTTTGIPPTAVPVVPSTTGATEEDDEFTREDELFEMTIPALKTMLRDYRNAGQEVTLRGNKASFVNQILLIENAGAIPAEQVMEAHKEAVEVAEAATVKETEEAKPDLSQAKAALLQKKRSQVDATKELQSTESGPAPDELKRLEEIILDMIRDVPGEKITWEDLGGDTNDMNIFPPWVTKDHRVLVETMIERIQKQLLG